MECRLALSETGVSIDKMEDGDIAIITKWRNDNLSPGTLLLRCGEAIILLGKSYDQSFQSFFHTKSDGFYVRILEPGETIVIT